MAERILAVDDEPVRRRPIENMVARFGYALVVAEGLGVLARMREAASNVPVVVEAAYGGIDYVVCAMPAGTID